MESDLTGRTVLVTGGAQGIGRGIAEALLAQGANVVVADRDAQAGRECIAAWDEPERALFVRLDVSNEANVRSAMSQVRKRFRGLDGLVNNAGIAQPESAPVEKLALRDWNRMLATDLTGPFLCAKHAVPMLRKSRGAIVNVSSTRARQSEPNTESYAAAKGGLEALTHALAISLGPAIRVNAIAPGWIDTSRFQKAAARARLRARDHAQHPVGRVGEKGDIAALVVFLLSPGAGFVTGQTFVADGGMSRKMIYQG